jgi:threonine/homoserine/homoserine lactone efflux protein
MPLSTLALFALTVLPLVCTPGPDVLFISAQGMARGRGAALRADLGVLVGYVAHGVLAAFGVAALVAAYPLLFEALRWAGVCYLACLALLMIRSALRPGPARVAPPSAGALLVRGFLTSFLNPKGLLLFFAILPQFIDPAGSVAIQAGLLSAVFIAMCGLVYGPWAWPRRRPLERA